MKVFKELRKHLAFVGIKPESESQFNIKNVIIVLILAFSIVSLSAFIIFEPISLTEFGHSFYGAACSALHIVTFSSNVLKSARIFKLFSDFEDVIKTRQFFFLHFIVNDYLLILF